METYCSDHHRSADDPFPAAFRLRPVEKSHGSSDNGKDKDRIKENGKDKDKGTDKDKRGHTDKILICHKTGSTKKLYAQISVANDAVKDGHAKHAGDLIPAPESGCPTK